MACCIARVEFIVQKLVVNPLFWLGLIIRLVLIVVVLPKAAASWYVPFLEITSSNLSWNPWQIFLQAGGSNIAFPYGYVMWLIFMPLTGICKLFGLAEYYGYSLTLLLADFSLLLLLRQLFNISNRLLLITYWLSPIVIFATYWLGLNDLVPVTLLCIALVCTKRHQFGWAGIISGAAVSAKLSMILAVPFFITYIYRNRTLRRLLTRYLFGLGLAALCLFLPFIFSQAGMSMLMHNPEMEKVYQLAVKIGDGITIYLLPMVYLLMLYLTWRIKRISFELLNILLGLAFFLVVLLTPAAPGWFVWLMPLLVIYQTLSGKVAIALTEAFSILYVLIGILLDYD